MGHGLYTEEQGVKLGCTLLLSAHSWTPPADALYSLVEAKAGGKLIFVSRLEIFSSIVLSLGDIKVA